MEKKIVVIDPGSDTRYDVHITRKTVEIKETQVEEDKPDNIITISADDAVKLLDCLTSDCDLENTIVRYIDGIVEIQTEDGTMDIPEHVALSIMLNINKYSKQLNNKKTKRHWVM